jgi:tRNA pseudouridine38-40 synthase
MTRWKLTLEYDGGAFVGWQRQDNGPSVQEALEDAVFAFSGEQVTSHAAGRTDSGVHALGQVAHIDLSKDLSAQRLQDALNHFLRRRHVAVREVEAVSADFHARFSATERAYRYRILNRRPPPALDAGRVWWLPVPLDAGAMAVGAAHLVGHHDFTSFRASACQAASPVKTLDHLTVAEAGEEIHVTAAARSFLHHQVRNIVGTLKLVGEGKWAPDRIERALAAKDRSAAGPTAPAEGLYLTGVRYDDGAVAE